MELQFERKALERALSAVTRATVAKSGILLSGVKIEARGDDVLFYATNNEVYIRYKTAAQIISPGETVVAGRLFHDLIHRMTADDIYLQTDDNALLVRASQAEYKVLTMKSNIFPELAPVRPLTSIPMTGAALKEIHTKTTFAAGKPGKVENVIFTGVHFHSKDGLLTVCGTNSHRLARKQISMEATPGEIILPTKTMAEIVSMVEPEDAVHLYWDTARAAFETDSFLYISPIIWGKFPNVEPIIPKETPIIAKVNRAELLAVLDRISLIGVEKIKDVELNNLYFSVSDGKLTIKAKTPDKGFAKEEVSATTEGTLDISLNGNNLLDCLRVMDSQDVTLAFAAPLRPMMITDEADASYLYIATPTHSKE